MRVNDIAKPDVVTAMRDTPVATVVAAMRENDVGSVVVVEDDRPVGIVTDRNVATALEEMPDVTQYQAGDVMTEDLVTVSGEASVFDLVGTLSDAGVRRVPVVDEDERLAGIVSLDDVLVVLARELSGVADLIEKQVPKAGFAPDAVRYGGGARGGSPPQQGARRGWAGQAQTQQGMQSQGFAGQGGGYARQGTQGQSTGAPGTGGGGQPQQWSQGSGATRQGAGGYQQGAGGHQQEYGQHPEGGGQQREGLHQYREGFGQQPAGRQSPAGQPGGPQRRGGRTGGRETDHRRSRYGGRH